MDHDDIKDNVRRRKKDSDGLYSKHKKSGLRWVGGARKYRDTNCDQPGKKKINTILIIIVIIIIIIIIRKKTPGTIIIIMVMIKGPNGIILIVMIMIKGPTAPLSWIIMLTMMAW